MTFDEDLAERMRDLLAAEPDRLVAATSARPMEMRGKEMRGWLRVDSADVDTGHELAAWVEIGTSYARSLPAK